MNLKNSRLFIRVAQLGGLLVTPAVAFGQTVGGIMAALAEQTVIVGTWIVVIMWVVTGILFLTSTGDAGKVGTARTSLLAAIAGTVLVIIARGAVALVKNSLGL